MESKGIVVENVDVPDFDASDFLFCEPPVEDGGADGM